MRSILSLVVALLAALAVGLIVTTAAASAASVAETRVGASSVAVGVLVGPPEHVSAGQWLRNEPVRVVVVVATGVAANSESFVYRGVSRSHPGYDDALRGTALPRNISGSTTAEAHNLGSAQALADSPFTSWTRDPAIARRFAGDDGAILRLPTGKPPVSSTWKFEWSPDVWFEQEVLVRGPVYGAGRLPR